MLNINDTHNTPEKDMIQTPMDYPEQEEDYDDMDKRLHQPTCDAATYTRNHDYASQSSSPFTYVASRCMACGLTQKECHQKWRELHDPKDPNTYPFLGYYVYH